jgi:hypothetical protein
VPWDTWTSGASGYWVEARKPKALSKPAVTGSSLASRTVAGIIAMSKEALASGDPRAERVFRDDCVRACAAMLDTALLDSTNAGSDSTPQSPLFGVSPVSSSGIPRADLSAGLEMYDGDLSTTVVIGDPIEGLQLALSGPAFSDCGPRGGICAGMPLLTSTASPRDTSGGQLVLLDAAGLAVALDDVEISISDQATLIMSDTPESEAQRVSLFQNELLALKVVLRANWEKQRENSVGFITGVDYTGT